MGGRSRKLTPAICAGILNAISLLASADGRTPCNWLVFPQPQSFLQVVVPASHSPQPGRKKASTTNDIFSPLGCGSSASLNLQSSLENKLRQRLGTDGLILYVQNWKQKATPLGRQFLAHTAG